MRTTFLIISILTVFVIANSCKTKERPKTTWFQFSSANFDTIIKGKKIGLYFLQNANGLEAAITNYGGRIVGLTVPDKNGKMADVVLGFNSIKDYLNANEVFHGALIGRVGNRIANGRFVLDNTEYQLPLNNGPNQLHGGALGFHNQIWEVVNVSSNSIVLKYLSKDGEMGYPGSLTTEVEYEFTNENEFVISYMATTDKKTVVNLTSHPFFNLNGEGSGTINNHVLKINADLYTPVDSTLIPLGQNVSVEGTPFDFREGKKIGRDLFDEEGNLQLSFGQGYDHNFVLNQTEKSKMFWAATITDPISGRSMEIHTVEPGLQFYGGNFMDGSDIGKSGESYKFRESFALETQHFPDTPNQPAFPSIELEKGDIYKSKTMYIFKTTK